MIAPARPAPGRAEILVAHSYYLLDDPKQVEKMRPYSPLDTLIKAAVLRELAAFPDVRRISTYNSESNAPMVAVNERLGFRPAGHLSTWSFRL